MTNLPDILSVMGAVLSLVGLAILLIDRTRLERSER